MDWKRIWGWTKTWRKWIAVVATGVLVGAIVLWLEYGKMPTGLESLAKPISRTGDVVFEYLGETVSIPRWWYWTLLLGLLAIVVQLVYRVRQRHFSPYLSYVEGTFNGIRWRWKWTSRERSGSRGIGWITPYCPKCDLELTFQREWDRLYYCGTCHKTYPYVDDEQVRKYIRREKSRKWPRIKD
jgi:hypothetical protein